LLEKIEAPRTPMLRAILWLAKLGIIGLTPGRD